MEPEYDIEEEDKFIAVTVGKLNRKEYKVDRRIESCSGLFQMLANTQGMNYDFEEIEPEEFDKCIEYLEMHSYNPPKSKLSAKSNVLSDNLCPKDYQFIKNYDIYDTVQCKLKKLIQAAIYLQLKTLEQICICHIATPFCFGNDMNSFLQLKLNLGIQKELTLEQEQKLKEKFGWVEKE